MSVIRVVRSDISFDMNCDYFNLPSYSFVYGWQWIDLKKLCTEYRYLKVPLPSNMVMQS